MEVLDFEKYKATIHGALLSRIDLEKLASADTGKARQAVAVLIQEIVLLERVPLNASEKGLVGSDLLDEVFGLGPLEPLLRDPSISDILVNNAHTVYIETRGMLQKTTTRFRDDRHLMQVIDRIVSRVGRRIDESSPMVDARLQDGSRVNAIIPPLALDGACLSIRRFGRDPVTARNMLENKTLTDSMLELLAAMVKGRLNLLISGGTGAGKTTLLNVLSGYIPNS